MVDLTAPEVGYEGIYLQQDPEHGGQVVNLVVSQVHR
jgi:hypothetical protein